MNKYLAIDIGEYLFTDCLRASNAAWLDASQRRRDNVRLNRSVREYSVKRIEQY